MHFRKSTSVDGTVGGPTNSKIFLWFGAELAVASRPEAVSKYWSFILKYLGH